jgi:hypothetical protein
LDVLDGALLSQLARAVIGAELSNDAMAHVQMAYVAPNLRFQDARKMPLGERPEISLPERTTLRLHRMPICRQSPIHCLLRFATGFRTECALQPKPSGRETAEER